MARSLPVPDDVRQRQSLRRLLTSDGGRVSTKQSPIDCKEQRQMLMTLYLAAAAVTRY